MPQTSQNRLLPYETSEEARLSGAVAQYFLHPAEDTLHALERCLSPHGASPRAAAVAIQAADAVLDAEINQLAAIIARQGSALVCRAGCTGCCCHLVPCQPFEAALIGLYITARPELHAFFEAAYPEWDERTRGLRESYLAWGERYYRDGVDDGAHRLEDYYTPCLFLHDGRCRIYPVRPYPCRSCVSVAEECRAPADPDGRPGMRSMDCGAYTTHKHSRTALTDLLWKICGPGPHAAVNRPMPDLVRCFLREGFPAVLRYASTAR